MKHKSDKPFSDAFHIPAGSLSNCTEHKREAAVQTAVWPSRSFYILLPSHVSSPSDISSSSEQMFSTFTSISVTETQAETRVTYVCRLDPSQPEGHMEANWQLRIKPEKLCPGGPKKNRCWFTGKGGSWQIQV